MYITENKNILVINTYYIQVLGYDPCSGSTEYITTHIYMLQWIGVFRHYTDLCNDLGF